MIDYLEQQRQRQRDIEIYKRGDLYNRYSDENGQNTQVHLKDKEEQKFWKDAYLAALRNEKLSSPEKYADNAILWIRERAPLTEEEQDESISEKEKLIKEQDEKIRQQRYRIDKFGEQIDSLKITCDVESRKYQRDLDNLDKKKAETLASLEAKKDSLKKEIKKLNDRANTLKEQAKKTRDKVILQESYDYRSPPIVKEEEEKPESKPKQEAPIKPMFIGRIE